MQIVHIHLYRTGREERHGIYPPSYSCNCLFNTGTRPLISWFSYPYALRVHRNRAWHDKRVIREKGWSRFSSHTVESTRFKPRRIWICQSEVSSQRVALRARECIIRVGTDIMPSRMLKDFFSRSEGSRLYLRDHIPNRVASHTESTNTPLKYLEEGSFLFKGSAW